MKERNLTRDVAAALLAPFDETYDPTETDLRYAEDMIKSLYGRRLRLVYLDERESSDDDLRPGRIPPLDFEIENALSAEAAYLAADVIAADFYGDQRYTLNVRGSAIINGHDPERFDVKFSARPIGAPDA